MTIGLNYNDVIRDLDFFMSPEYSNSIDNFCNLEIKKTKEEFEEQVVKSYEVYQKRKNDNQSLVFNTTLLLTHIFSFISSDESSLLSSVCLDKVAKMRLVCHNWKNKTEQLLQLKWNELRNCQLIKIPINNIDLMHPKDSYITKFKFLSNAIQPYRLYGGPTLETMPLNESAVIDLSRDRDLITVWKAIVQQTFPPDTSFVIVIGKRPISIRANQMNSIEVRKELKEERTQLFLNAIKKLNLQKLALWFLPAEIFVHLKNLESLELWNNNLEDLLPEITQLINLKRLDLGSNKLKKLPAEVGNLTKLERFSLAENKLEYLPSEICKLNKLNFLSLIDNPLKVVPKFSYSINDFVIVRATPSFSPTHVLVQRQAQEIQFKATSPWALLYQAMLSGNEVEINKNIKSLSLNNNEEFQLLFQMMLECDGINPKKRNREGNSKDQVNKVGLPKVGPCVFDLAVKRIIVEKYEELNSLRKEKVEQVIYTSTNTPMPTEPSKRSQFALLNLPQLADALAEEAKSNTK
jgi:hypothetical protein